MQFKCQVMLDHHNISYSVLHHSTYCNICNIVQAEQQWIRVLLWIRNRGPMCPVVSPRWSSIIHSRIAPSKSIKIGLYSGFTAEFLGACKLFNCQQIWRILNWLKLFNFLFRLAWTKMIRLSIICLAKTKEFPISAVTTVCLNGNFYSFGRYFSP